MGYIRWIWMNQSHKRSEHPLQPPRGHATKALSFKGRRIRSIWYTKRIDTFLVQTFFVNRKKEIELFLFFEYKIKLNLRRPFFPLFYYVVISQVNNDNNNTEKKYCQVGSLFARAKGSVKK